MDSRQARTRTSLASINSPHVTHLLSCRPVTVISAPKAMHKYIPQHNGHRHNTSSLHCTRSSVRIDHSSQSDRSMGVTRCLQRSSRSLFLLMLLVAAAISSVSSRDAAIAASSSSASPKKKKPKVPALVVFGDSIVDPGNNNDINTIVKANFRPYGKDFGRDHRPTGRFCNGRIPTDFIASRLGLKELLPAYLTPNLTNQDILTGVSFASGGTGYDPLTAQLATVISMTDQLRMFEDYKQKVRAAGGDAALATMLSDGVFAVCAGSDDVANTYFTMRARSDYDHASYAALMVDHATSFLDGLLAAGARRVAVISVPPIGCVPSQRTLSGGMARDCSQGHNEVATMVNAGMTKSMDTLKAKHPGAKLVLMDIYGFLLDMMMRPQSYGFKESTLGCCGTGMMEVSVLCNGVTSAVCGEVKDYLFWDSYHPTEKAYKILVDFVYDNYLNQIIN